MKETDQNQAGNGELSYYPRSSLAYRLLIYILICGSALTLIATAIQLYFSYKVDINRIDQNLQFIEKSYVPEIASSVYKVDMEQMELQLKGILQLPDIIHAKIREPRGNDEFVLSQGDDNARRDMIHRYPLSYQVESNETVPLGELTVAVSKAQVWSRLWGRVAVILLTNSTKTLITCLCILGIFHLFLIRHLQSINRAIVTWSPDKANHSLKLERKRSNEHPRKDDELDAVARSLNHMWRWIESDRNTIKAIQSSLKESNERFKAYMENSTEAIWCIDLTEPINISLPVQKQLDLVYENAYLSECNDAYAKMAGFQSREELIGITLAEIMPRDKPENVAMLMELIQNQFTTVGHESIGRFLDGKELILLNNLVGILKDGFIHRYWGTALDITKLRKVETELREAEQQLRLITDSLPVFIAYVDSDGRYIFNNKAYLDFFNLTIDQIAGKPIKEILGAEAYKHVRPHVKKVLDGERTCFEVEIPRSGTNHQIESTYIPDKDKNGTVNGFFVLATDVTERKQREVELQRHREELAHVSRLTTMGELTASMAHELNQPLTAILSNAQAARRFLEHDTVDIEEVKEILDDIIGDDRRAGQVIKRLRGFLKPGEFSLKAWDINEVIQEVITLIHSDAVIRNVSVHLDLQKGLPHVFGDRIQIQQVLLNLIINGLDAMIEVHPESRKLIIKTKYEQDRSVTVSVGDSGTGIKPDQIKQIFEPFHTTKADGMGMGLSINRAIIQAHHGELWAENNTNQGATFFFTLSIASKDNNDA